MEEEFEDDQPAAHGTASTTAASSMAKTILDHTQYPWDDELQAHVRQDPEDPSVLFAWDIERSAWFPVFRNDLIDRQQSAYNHSFDTIKPPKPKDDSSGDAPPKKGGTKRKPDQQKTTLHMSESSIYVTRLPNDTTVEELSTYFSRCGLILPDAVTGKPRIKLYKDASTNQLKGDALITFFRPESVQLALTLFDDSDLRPGVRIRVEKVSIAFAHQSINHTHSLNH